jgi:hypothetical protein
MERSWLRPLKHFLLLLLLGAGMSMAGEQVLLLSEAGSGAHAFTSILASESKAIYGDDMFVAWDPCAVVRRQRAAAATLKEGTASAGLAFTARECSFLVQVIHHHSPSWKLNLFIFYFYLEDTGVQCYC